LAGRLVELGGGNVGSREFDLPGRDVDPDRGMALGDRLGGWDARPAAKIQHP
jgi:hypothetical protein